MAFPLSPNNGDYWIEDGQLFQFNPQGANTGWKRVHASEAEELNYTNDNWGLPTEEAPTKTGAAIDALSTALGDIEGVQYKGIFTADPEPADPVGSVAGDWYEVQTGGTTALGWPTDLSGPNQVPAATVVTAGDRVRFNGTKWYWVDLSGGAAATTLSGLTDTEITGPLQTGDFLIYDVAAPNKWVDRPLVIGDIADFQPGGAVTGSVFQYDGANWSDALPTWDNLIQGKTAIGDTGVILTVLDDVAASAATTNNFLFYNGTSFVGSKGTAGAAGDIPYVRTGGPSVHLGAPTTGVPSALVWDGTDYSWSNQAIPAAAFQGSIPWWDDASSVYTLLVPADDGGTPQVAAFNNVTSQWDLIRPTASDQYLKWTGTNLTWAVVAGGGGFVGDSIGELGDVAVAPYSERSLLQFIGSEWVEVPFTVAPGGHPAYYGLYDDDGTGALSLEELPEGVAHDMLSHTDVQALHNSDGGPGVETDQGRGPLIRGGISAGGNYWHTPGTDPWDINFEEQSFIFVKLGTGHVDIQGLTLGLTGDAWAGASDGLIAFYNSADTAQPFRVYNPTTPPAAGGKMHWDDTAKQYEWVNPTTVNHLEVWNGSTWVSTLLELNALADIDTTGFSSGDVLQWDGISQWKPVAGSDLAGPGSSLANTFAYWTDTSGKVLNTYAALTVAGSDLKLTANFLCDTILERTTAAGVTIDGVLLKDSNLSAASLLADTIEELTPAAGVTIDGVLIKDNAVTLTGELTGSGVITLGPGALVHTGISGDQISLDDGVLNVDGDILQDVAGTIYPGSDISMSLTGNIVMGNGTVDGRDVSVDGATLDVLDSMYFDSDATESSSIGNTVTETDFDVALTDIPANHLAVGSTFRAIAMGRMNGDSFTPGTATLRLRLDNTEVASTGIVNNETSGSNEGWRAEFYFIVTSIGGTGGARGRSSFATIGNNPGSTATDRTDSTLDTTQALTPEISVEFSVADADNAATMDMFILEQLN